MLWGWAMLLVVLLSAAPTGGQPRTRHLGSAFDPATLSVVLSPKQPRLNGAVSSQHRKKLPETEGGDAIYVAGLAAGAVRNGPARPRVRPSYHSALSVGAGHLLTSTQGPRAPPRG